MSKPVRPPEFDGPGARPPGSSDDSNVAQLKDDIDRGRTGDKVAIPDPAAAPLGTDAEAAGTSPSPGEIARARRAETRRAQRQPATAKTTRRAPWHRVMRPGLLAAVAVAVLVLASWLIL